MLFLCCMMFWQQRAPADEVFIPDNALRSRLVNLYDLDNNGYITEAEAAYATGEIDFTQVSVRDLTGLEFFTSLSGLSFVDLQINTIPDLATMTGLESLTFRKCTMPDLITLPPNLTMLRLEQDGLNSIPTLPANLEIANLALNNLSDLPGLEQLTQLKSLQASYNPIASLPDLSGTQIETLYISGCQLSALPLLPSTVTTIVATDCLFAGSITLPDGLHYASLDNNSLTGIQNLSDMTQLTTLRLSNNQFASLDIGHLTLLTLLNVSGNSLNSITGLQNLTALASINCDNNNISDLSAVSELPNLVTLSAKNNALTIAPDFFAYPSLRNVYLDDNQITALPSPSQSTSLYTLSARGNALTSIPDLGSLTQLSRLYVDQNALTHLPTLPSNLAYLTASENQIQSYDFTQLSKLTQLDVHNNQFTVLDLTGLNQLSYLDFSDNQVTVLPNITSAGLRDLFFDRNLVSDLSPLLTSSIGSSTSSLTFTDNLLDQFQCANIFNLAKRYWDQFEYSPQISAPAFECVPGPSDPILIPELFPDNSFRNHLKSSLSSSLTAAQALTITTINVSGTYYGTFNGKRDLTGIRFFENLISLDASDNQIQNVNELGSLIFLEHIELDGNALTSIPDLDALGFLQSLDITSNQLVSLPALPIQIQELNAGQNMLASLPPLDGHTQMTNLSVFQNSLTLLPALPANLVSLNVWQNQLSFLPSLPVSLTYLYCGSNQLTELPLLSPSLHSIVADNNLIAAFPDLTTLDELYNLNLVNNQIDDISLLIGTPFVGSQYHTLRLTLNLLDSGDCDDINQVKYQFGNFEYQPQINAPNLSCVSPAVPVPFSDPGLESYARSNFDYDGDGLVSIDEARSVHSTAIAISNLGITSLDGIQYFSNLSYLFCDDNQLTDIDPIENLGNLVTLSCANNRIEHLPSFAQQTHLQSLNLNENLITQLPDLSTCNELNSINLEFNQISSIQPLVDNPAIATKSWASAFLANNNLLPDECSNLEVLGSRIIDSRQFRYHPQNTGPLICPFDPVVPIPDPLLHAQLIEIADENNDGQVTENEAAGFDDYSIILDNSGVRDLQGIQHFTQLRNLQASFNQISNVPDLQALDHLTTLYLSYNYIQNLPTLPPTLRTLGAGFNNIQSMPDISSMTQLQNLYLDHNQIGFVPDFPQLDSLTSIRLDNNNLLSFPSTQHLGALRFLRLQRNQLTAIGPLPPSIHTLNISFNELDSLAPIPPTMRYLYAHFNRLTSIDEITQSNLGVSGNDVLWVWGNLLEQNSCTAITELTTRNWYQFEYEPQLGPLPFICVNCAASASHTFSPILWSTQFSHGYGIPDINQNEVFDLIEFVSELACHE